MFDLAIDYVEELGAQRLVHGLVGNQPLTAVLGSNVPLGDRLLLRIAPERLHFFALDATNPSSIYCCLQAARTNAHAVRGRITADMWENINATWIEMRNIASNGLGRYGISQFCDWVKERSHLFRGATSGTIMRNDAYSFIRLGTFLERADNTLRLLDARYEMFGEESDEVSDQSARKAP